MLYKVIILYFKCVFKRKQRSNAPLKLPHSLCSEVYVWAWACVDAYVRVCFQSAMTYREHLWLTLLPNITLFLLALLVL